MVKALAQLTNWEEKLMDTELDNAYRVNSRFATMRKLPSDVLVHFLRRTTRHFDLLKWIAILNSN